MMDSWLIDRVRLRADGRQVQAQYFCGSKADLGQLQQGTTCKQPGSRSQSREVVTNKPLVQKCDKSIRI